MTVRTLLRWLIPAWFAAVLLLGAAGAFTGAPGAPPVAIVLGFTLPIAAFVAAYLGSRAFRDAVLSADLRLLSALQGWRFGGFWFLALWAYGVLPGLFAIPAGLGDVAVGAFAPFVAQRIARDPRFAASRRFATWNVLGILDLVMAVSLGGLSSGAIPGLTTVTSAAMAQLPLVLIPAFFVPLLVSVHLAALLRARRAAAEARRGTPTDGGRYGPAAA